MIPSRMAERADLVLLTFDAHKLDISDEFQQVLQVLLPHADKAGLPCSEFIIQGVSLPRPSGG